MKINNHAIKVMDNWQSPYGLIYNLAHVKLETLKTYIKNYLINSFIKSSKFPIRAPIFFDKKSNGNIRLYIDYYNLNNLIIKN